MNLSESYKKRLSELAGTKLLTESSVVKDRLNALTFKNDVESIGGKLYAVGGINRDEILGKPSKDLDILITGVPLDRLEHILVKHGKVKEVGKSFGIIKFVPFGETEDIDIAIPRTEKSIGTGHQGFEVTSDHTLPIEDDLARRDFSLNSLAQDSEGNIIDPFGGLEDIKNKIIRVTNEKSFGDDALRMLRAVSFSARFGFTIEPNTMTLIKMNAHKIKEISPERYLIEFDKIIKKGDIQYGMDVLIGSGLFKEMFGFDYVGDKNFSKVKIMADLTYKLLENSGNLASSFYKNKWKGETNVENQIKALELQEKLTGDKLEDRKIVQKILNISPNIEDCGLLKDNTKTIIKIFVDNSYPLNIKNLDINGNDLMAMGFKKEEIGKNNILIMQGVLSDEIPNKKEDIMKFIEEINKKPENQEQNIENEPSGKPSVYLDSKDNINSITEARKVVRNILLEFEKNKTLKSILDSDEAYLILDSSKATGTMWTQGGCAILAFALSKVYGYPVYVIYDNGFNQADHFVVKTPRNTFVDYRGETKDIINKFKEDEMLWKKDFSLVPYKTGMNMSDIVIDEKASDKLAELIKNKMK